MITRKEPHFREKPTRLRPAILRVEEEVKKKKKKIPQGLSRIHLAAGNASGIN